MEREMFLNELLSDPDMSPIMKSIFQLVLADPTFADGLRFGSGSTEKVR